MKKTFFRFSLLFAWMVALLATLGSLYYSAVLHLPPCNLCWYQRVFLFPLAFILGIAAFRNERKIGMYVFPLVVLGALVALFQGIYPLLKSFGWIHLGQDLCGPVSCFQETYRFLKIPLAFWSFSAFILIGIFLRLSYSTKL